MTPNKISLNKYRFNYLFSHKQNIFINVYDKIKQPILQLLTKLNGQSGVSCCKGMEMQFYIPFVSVDG